MLDNYWDNPALSTGEYVKFVEVGDKIVGKIVARGMHTFPDGKECRKLTILEDGETEPRILTVGQVKLEAELKKLRPSVGDRIAIVFRELEKRDGGKTMKHFDVEVGPSTTPAAPPAGVPATSLLG